MRKFINKFKKSIKPLKIIIKGTILICPRCKSLNIKHYKTVVDKTDDFITETYKVKCRDCERIGLVKEVWYK